jgi:hypothetical protein
MAILDKANVNITAYEVVMEDDGYGGEKPGKGNSFSFKAFVLPVGWSGAGWAIDSRLEAQGWAELDRVRLIFKTGPALKKWAKVEIDGEVWTVTEEPRSFKGFRASQNYTTATLELEGDV